MHFRREMQRHFDDYSSIRGPFHDRPESDPKAILFQAPQKNGRYQLTSFGKVVFDWHLNLKEIITKEYWRLAAIDTLSQSGMPDSDKAKITNSLIESEQVRRLLAPSP